MGIKSAVTFTVDFNEQLSSSKKYQRIKHVEISTIITNSTVAIARASSIRLFNALQVRNQTFPMAETRT